MNISRYITMEAAGPLRRSPAPPVECSPPAAPPTGLESPDYPNIHWIRQPSRSRLQPNMPNVSMPPNNAVLGPPGGSLDIFTPEKRIVQVQRRMGDSTDVDGVAPVKPCISAPTCPPTTVQPSHLVQQAAAAAVVGKTTPAGKTAPVGPVISPTHPVIYRPPGTFGQPHKPAATPVRQQHAANLMREESPLQYVTAPQPASAVTVVRRAGRNAVPIGAPPPQQAHAAVPAGRSTAVSGASPNAMSAHVVNGKWVIKQKLGYGSFGDVYLVVHLETNEAAALKMERMDAKHPQILHEARILRHMQGIPGFPKIHYSGVHRRHWNVVVMERLGPSLEDVLSDWHDRHAFPHTLIGALGLHMIERLEALHRRGIIHRDVKPENFLLGSPEHSDRARLVYCIDFGLAKWYRDPRTKQHTPYASGRSLTGTARYASVNAHAGIEPSRRDDVISVGYTLVYFAQGSLPWQGLVAPTRESKHYLIMQKKKGISNTDLTRGFPAPYLDFMNHVTSLDYAAEPDYKLLQDYMKQLIITGQTMRHIGSPRSVGGTTRDMRNARQGGHLDTTHRSALNANSVTPPCDSSRNPLSQLANQLIYGVDLRVSSRRQELERSRLQQHFLNAEKGDSQAVDRARRRGFQWFACANVKDQRH